jgi:hypothetical protein
MRHRPLAPLLLTTVAAVAIAACSGGSGTSAAPSAAAPSPSMSEAPASEAPASAAPSESASAAPSAVPSGSAEGTRVDVVGTEYEYSGPITIAFRNEGAEVHEIVVVKKNEGVTQSWEELLALPEDQSGAFVTFAGVAFAEPGQTAAEMVTASEPGEYLGICFIPAGTTELPSLDPNASGPPDLGTGAPHFTLGMLTEFTITE